MNKQQIKEYVEKNKKYVSVQQSANYPELSVLKFSKKAFYENKWDRYLEECRGTVIDDNWNVISRPFTKIYNFGIEKNAPEVADTEIVDAYRKVNGFMVAVSLYKGQVLVSTTGSLDSDYVSMAKELLDLKKAKKVCSMWPTTTFMFECVHPNDPHIIPEQTGMYLIGYRSNFWDSVVSINPQVLQKLALEFGAIPVKHQQTTVAELKQQAKVCNHEGFVAYTQDNRAFKIKSPFYLVSKWMARKVDTSKITAVSFKQSVDEEYYPLVDYIVSNLETFTEKTEQARLEMIRNFLEVGNG